MLVDWRVLLFVLLEKCHNKGGRKWKAVAKLRLGVCFHLRWLVSVFKVRSESAWKFKYYSITLRGCYFCFQVSVEYIAYWIFPRTITHLYSWLSRCIISSGAPRCNSKNCFKYCYLFFAKSKLCRKMRTRVLF